MTVSAPAVTSDLGWTLWRRTWPNCVFEVSGRAWCTVKRTGRFQVALTIRASLRQPGDWNDLFSEAGGTAGPPQLLSPPAALHRLTATVVILPLFFHPPLAAALNLAKISNHLF